MDDPNRNFPPDDPYLAVVHIPAEFAFPIAIPAVPIQAIPEIFVPEVEIPQADSNSLHTDDLMVGAQPGDATRARQEMAILMDGGNVVQQSGPASPTSDNSVNDTVSPKSIAVENHPSFIRNNQARIDYENFLKSKGLFEDFCKHQASLSKLKNRIVDSNGLFVPTLKNNIAQTDIPQSANIDTIAEVTNSINPTELNPVIPLTWKSVVKSNIPKADFVDTSANVCINADGTTSINPSMGFLLNSRKLWNTSCVGHFVGGGFDFKYIKAQTMKLWKQKGLTNVLYNSKGFYTFKFKTEDEMSYVLSHRSVVFGGKRMYLGPWIEGTNFQKNIIPRVQVWTKFSNVPHSYWTADGLGMIARAVGIPIRLDNLTEKMEPMKFAGVLIEISYDSPRPSFVWVPVINDLDGSIVKVAVEVSYSFMPLSCSICKAFGHSLARCSMNPENLKSQQDDIPETSRAAAKRQKKDKQQFLGCDVEKDPEVIVHEPIANPATVSISDNATVSVANDDNLHVIEEIAVNDIVAATPTPMEAIPGSITEQTPILEEVADIPPISEDNQNVEIIQENVTESQLLDKNKFAVLSENEFADEFEISGQENLVPLTSDIQSLPNSIQANVQRIADPNKVVNTSDQFYVLLTIDDDSGDKDNNLLEPESSLPKCSILEEGECNQTKPRQKKIAPKSRNNGAPPIQKLKLKMQKRNTKLQVDVAKQSSQ